MSVNEKSSTTQSSLPSLNVLIFGDSVIDPNTKNFLSSEFDNENMNYEGVATMGIATSTVGTGYAIFSVAAAGAVYPPLGITIAIILATYSLVKILNDVFRRSTRAKELQYISAACSSYCVNVMAQMKTMFTFYEMIHSLRENSDDDDKTLIDEDIHIFNKNPLWSQIVNSLYKFQLFILDMIDISTITDSTSSLEHKFLTGILNNVTFSLHQEERSKYMYHYTDEKNQGVGARYISEIKTSTDKSNGEYFYLKKYQDATPTLALKNARNAVSSVVSMFKPSSGISDIKELDTNKFEKLTNVTFNDLITNRYEKIFRRYLYDKFGISICKQKVYDKNNQEIKEGALSSYLSNDPKNAGSLLVDMFIRHIGDLKTQSKQWVSNKLPACSTGGKKNTRRRGDRNNKHTRRRMVGGNAPWFPAVNELYRQLIREYTILSANFGILTNQHLVRYNNFMLLCSDSMKSRMKRHILEKDVESAKLELNLARGVIPNDAGRVTAAEIRVAAAEKRRDNVSIPATAEFLQVASSVPSPEPP